MGLWWGRRLIEYIILLAVAVAGVCGIIITKNVFGSNEIHGKLKNRYLEYIANLESDNKKLNGKLNKMKNNLSIAPADVDPDNPMGSIGALISQFAPMLPKNIQPLLSDPNTMKYITKLASENPEKVQDLISKFIKKPKSNEPTAVDMESV